MTAPAAQYDHIVSKYDEYARTATLKRAEQYTTEPPTPRRYSLWNQPTYE